MFHVVLLADENWEVGQVLAPQSTHIVGFGKDVKKATSCAYEKVGDVAARYVYLSEDELRRLLSYKAELYFDDAERPGHGKYAEVLVNYWIKKGEDFVSPMNDIPTPKDLEAQK